MIFDVNGLPITLIVQGIKVLKQSLQSACLQYNFTALKLHFSCCQSKKMNTNILIILTLLVAGNDESSFIHKEIIWKIYASFFFF